MTARVMYKEKILAFKLNVLDYLSHLEHENFEL